MPPDPPVDDAASGIVNVTSAPESVVTVEIVISWSNRLGMRFGFSSAQFRAIVEYK